MSSLSNVDFKNLVGSKKRKVKLPSSATSGLSEEVQRELELDAQAERKRKSKKPRANQHKPGDAARYKPEPEISSGVGRGQPLNKPSASKLGSDVPGRPKYRDRAAERRSGKTDFEEMATEVAAEYSKFLGGDASNTHMVKGLDLQLMQKTIKEKNLQRNRQSGRNVAYETVGPHDGIQDGLSKKQREKTGAAEGDMPLVLSDYARRVYLAFVQSTRPISSRKSDKELADFSCLSAVEYCLNDNIAGALPKTIAGVTAFAQAESKYSDVLMNPLDKAVLATVKNAYVSFETRKKHAESVEAKKEEEASSSDDDDDIFSGAGKHYEVDYDALAKKQEKVDEEKAKEEAVSFLNKVTTSSTGTSSKALWDEFEAEETKPQAENGAELKEISVTQRRQPEKSSKDLWGEFDEADD